MAQVERNAAVVGSLDHERRFELLVEAVTDYAIFLLDPDGFVASWNTGARRIKGYEPDEIIGHHFSSFFTDEDRADGLPQRYLATAARYGRCESEGWRVRKDGTRFWALAVIDAVWDDHGHLIGFAKITRDITERKATQEALLESERRFRLLVEGVTDYAIYMLDPEGIITNWNTGAERHKGYAVNEIIGQHFSRFYTDEDRAAGLPARALAQATETGKFESEGWRVRKDGTRFWAHVVVDAIRDESGALIGFAKISRDVTERRDTQLALERAQKMEALGQLTGGIAHDFNNLLMVVSGRAQNLRRRLTEPKDVREIEAIQLAASRGAALTRKLLTFARKQPAAPVVVALSDRTETLRELIASSLRGDIALTFEVPPDIWPILVDPNELELALINVAVNGRDAMPDGGSLRMTARNVTLAPSAVPSAAAGDYVAVSIQDTGTGIADDVLPKIFDPFFTTKDVDKGTGLGLSQVYGCAHQSGGTVTVASRLGHGTTITLYFPRTRVAANAVQTKPSRRGRKGEGTILVVEDNPDVADISSAFLADLGYKVRVVHNAAAALAEIDAGTPFVLVFSDVVMPGNINGAELAVAIRQRRPTLPVLLTSGYSDATQAAGTHFPMLRKPYELSELEDAVRTAIERHRSANPAA